MKILIVSDSHGDVAALRKAVDREKPDQVFHLGDVNRDAQRLSMSFPLLPIAAVKGNCDAWSGGEAPDRLALTIEGIRFFLCHGHMQRVKMGTALLLHEGQGEGADVVCFGHTHKAVCQPVSGLWLVNPGSIGGSGTYAVAEVEHGAVTVELRTL